MTNEEVRSAIAAELSFVFAAAMLACSAGTRETDAGWLWLREHGSEEARKAGVHPFKFCADLAKKLAFDACARLPDPGSRTIVAIKDALRWPPIRISEAQRLQLLAQVLS